MVDVSFIATVYNSVDAVSVSLQGVIEIIEKLPNLDFEIVIVDNFSHYGTYEKLLDFKAKAMNTSNLKRFLVVRLRSSRGLGRQLALRLARGKYVIPIDLDIRIDADKLAKIILKYRELKVYKCLILANPGVHLICPRELLLRIGGYKDLNYGEDIELLARIFHNNAAISLPIKIASDLRFAEVLRERRYSRSILHFMYRKLSLLKDRALAYRLTPRKLVREHWYVHKNNVVKVALNLMLHLPIFIYVKLNKTEGFSHILTNALLVDFLTYKTMVDPKSFGFTREDIIEYFRYFRNTREFHYIARYLDEVSIGLNSKG